MDSLRAFTLQRPASVAEACAMLAAAPGARLLAGGTDLLVNLRHGIGAPHTLISLDGIAALCGVGRDAAGLTIGAGTTLRVLAADPGVRRDHPALAEAAAAVAGPAHRAVATVGGNLCLDTRCVYLNQSRWWREANGFCLKHEGDTCHVAPQGDRCHAAFCGDLAPALIALGANVTLVSVTAERTVSAGDLYAEDGRAHLRVAPDEIVASVHVPAAPSGSRSGYRKLRVRAAIDFPLAGVAMSVAVDCGRLAALSVALTGTNACPFELQGTAALLGRPPAEAVDDLARLVRRQVAPMRTTVTGANYRRQAVAALAGRLLCDLAQTGATAVPGAAVR
jgi:4-hydroxybenzoyl-CoA reductase subunit beta